MIEGFFRLEILDSGILGDYFGVDFWSRDAFLALLEALGIFWGFDICPHHLKSGVPLPPLPPGVDWLTLQWFSCDDALFQARFHFLHVSLSRLCS